ncbi:MAG: hypothetical protein KTR26_01760 [Flammeovirgaceae bacterium]|nr:hypothetical protein [Flammeovirgaceae bacterium]
MNFKLAVIFSGAFLVIFLTWGAYSSYLFLQDITSFEKVSLEKSRGELKDKVNVVGNGMPSDYGYKNSIEIKYNSFDGTKLSGWLIRSKDTDTKKCLVLIHDRYSNRIEMLKYLQIIKELQLENEYHIVLPDLRNSGNSEQSKTQMGYKFSEDIISLVGVLNVQLKIQEVCFYGVGMGAISAAIAVRRRDLQSYLQEKNVFIESLILDSPYSNVKEQIKRNGNGYAEIIQNSSLYFFNNTVEGYLDFMRLGALLEKVEQRVLILQNIGDEITPTDLLLSELNGNNLVKLELFDGDEHGNIYPHPSYRNKYLKLVKDFFKEAE